MHDKRGLREGARALVEEILGGVYGFPKPIKADAIKAALDAGADPFAADWRGLSPLMAAATSGGEEEVGLLLDAGADPLRRCLLGQTALHKAAGSQTTGLAIRRLLDAGCDPNGRDRAGDTPLHRAAHASLRNGMAVTEALLKGGADPLAVDRDGRRPSCRLGLAPDPKTMELLAAAEQRAEMLVDEGVKAGTPSEPEGGRKAGRGL